MILTWLKGFEVFCAFGALVFGGNSYDCSRQLWRFFPQTGTILYHLAGPVVLILLGPGVHQSSRNQSAAES